MIDESRDSMVVVTQRKSHLAKIGDPCPSEDGDKGFFNIK